MKTVLKLPVFVLITLLVSGCSSDDCMKTISIPQFYYVNNQSYSYETQQKVPCDFPEPTDAELIEPPLLENFSYEVLKFEYTPDIPNNSFRLQMEIKLNNPNDYPVSGIPILTVDIDGIQSSAGYHRDASMPCYEIGAGSSCIFTYDQEFSMDLGIIDSFKLINVEYLLTGEL